MIGPSKRPQLLAAAAILISTLSVGTAGLSGQSAPAASGAVPTFTRDIAPIFQQRCQECHRPGSIAPMSLMTYEQVRPWARAIKTRTSNREMPPWFVEKNIGIQKFMNDISLTDEQIATIARWVDGGAPLGNPADMPPPRTFAGAEEWTIGKPDLVVSSPEFIVKAVAADSYPRLDLTALGLNEDRYVAAVEFKEVKLGQGFGRTEGRTQGDLTLFSVHHAAVGTTNPDAGGAGFRDDGAFQLTYEVGQNATYFPDDAAPVLEAGTSLSWNMHLHSSGREVKARLDVGFKLHPAGYKPKYVQRSIQFGRIDFLIKPLTANQRVEAFWTLPQAGKLVTFEPHMHMSGVRKCVEAIYPNLDREMLNCVGYNHNWVKVYVYDPDYAPLLPKGTILRMIGWYDTSPTNPRVVEPRNAVMWGNRTIDDMLFFKPRMVFLTDEQFKEEVEARQAKRLAEAARRSSTGGQQ